ncbi:MAG TPA: flagellar hook-associated protein FlgK [Bacteroidota bacterium]|nr:flagellar hook-associated protein FlgK [Bacteroidota bacterium]
MAGLSLILETARRALLAQQVGLSVTSHNVANASTPGYSRQVANLSATTPLPQTYGMLGTGVTVDSVTRMRDAFLDQQIRDVNQSMSQASMENQILSQVQASFSEPSDQGISSAMSKFFNAWQDLADNPEDSAARNAVLQQGIQLTQSFHTLNSDLTQLRSSLLDDVSAKVEKINSLTQELASLDTQITSAKALGQDANDAMDQRDQDLQDLSQLVNINVSYDSIGSMTVSTGGVVIASRAGATALQSAVNGNQIQISAGAGGPTVNVTGGELGGVLNAYNTDIPTTLAQIDQVAGTLITQVNQVHSAGYGIGTPPPTGNDFFTGTGAADITVNPALQANSNLIAGSSDGTPGDNATALAIVAIENKPVLNGNSESVMQFYNGVVSSLGSQVSSTQDMTTQQQAIMNQLNDQQASVSGVSLDEEMTNMITFQRGYDAAAKLITTVDDMFQTLMQM